MAPKLRDHLLKIGQIKLNKIKNIPRGKKGMDVE
jgi:hypothetical protein